MSSVTERNLLKSYCQGWGVNIGCGPRPVKGAINVDIDPNADADLFADASVLPFHSNRFDYLVSSHCLEHVRQAPLIVLREWLRVLKVGGRIAFLVPNGGDGSIALGASPGKFVDGRHVNIFTMQTLEILMNYAGAADVKMQIIEREEWTTKTILATGRKLQESHDISDRSIAEYLIWLKSVRKTLTPKGAFGWLRKGW